MPVTLLPSAEAITIAWATNNADLAPLHGGRVATKLATTLPAIRVARIGDSPPETWEDVAEIQFEFWANTIGPADAMTRTFIQALPSIRGYTQGTGKVLTYEITAGPFWAEDDLTNWARYIVTVAFLIVKGV